MGPITILIVDDEDEIRLLVRKILTVEGYSVLEARNGREMFQVLENNRPELILLDVMLPETDGYELCRRIRQQAATRELPVILLTVLATPANIRMGEEAGASAYLTKPFDPSVLSREIRKLLPH